MKLLLDNKKKQQLKQIATLLLYVLIGHLPFLSVVPAIGMLKEFLCIGICICALLNWDYKFNWGTVCVLAYTLSVGLGVMLNPELGLIAKVNVLRYRCMYAVTFCVFFHGFRFTKTDMVKIGEDILKIVYWVGLVVALVGVVEFVNPSLVRAIYGENLTSHLTVILNNNAETRLISTMGNPINLGLQMSLPIVSGLYFAQKKEENAKRVKKVLYYLSVVLFAAVAIYTYSRTAYVVIIGAVMTFYLAQILFEKGQKKKKMILLAAILLAVIAFVAFLMVNESVAARFSKISLASLRKNARFARAYTAFEQAGKGWFGLAFGYGAGRIMGATQQYVFEFGYASLLYEAGIFGLLLFAFAVLKSVAAGIKAIHRGGCTALLQLSNLCIIAGFCVAMIAEDVYFQLPICLFFWLNVFMMDVLNAAYKNEEQTQSLQ